MYKILKCDHSNESYWAVLSCDADDVVQGDYNFSSLWTKPLSVTIQMKATEQYFSVVLFTMLCKVILTFRVCGWDPKVWPFESVKATEQCFPVVLFVVLYKVILTFEPVEEILKCDHSN